MRARAPVVQPHGSLDCAPKWRTTWTSRTTYWLARAGTCCPALFVRMRLSSLWPTARARKTHSSVRRRARSPAVHPGRRAHRRRHRPRRTILPRSSGCLWDDSGIFSAPRLATLRSPGRESAPSELSAAASRARTSRLASLYALSGSRPRLCARSRSAIACAWTSLSTVRCCGLASCVVGSAGTSSSLPWAP